MRWLAILLIALQLPASGQQLTRRQLRDMFLAATERKGALDSLTSRLEAIDNKAPVEESYYGMCHGLYCSYETTNWAKLRHVMKAKNLLNSAVERNSKDPELRFLRFMLEHFLPSFLGLNKHIDEDLGIVFSNPGFIDDNAGLKHKILSFLIWTKRCNPTQTKQLQAQLDDLNKKAPAALVKGN